MIKVLVCDDHLIVRQGIKQILADAPEIVLAGEAASGPEAVRLVREASTRGGIHGATRRCHARRAERCRCRSCPRQR